MLHTVPGQQYHLAMSLRTTSSGLCGFAAGGLSCAAVRPVGCLGLRLVGANAPQNHDRSKCAPKQLSNLNGESYGKELNAPPLSQKDFAVY
jgi:hypothetical protein